LGGATLADALCLGVACGSANALVLGAGVMHRTDVDRLLAEVVLHPI
jgi:fructose-1-phosphate kinase PfkB-like protein